MSIKPPRSPKHLPITLRSIGPTEADGSMRIEYVTKALQGLAGAYEKIAADISPLEHHELRVADINPTSFDLVILAAMGIGQYADQLSAIKSAAEGNERVIKVITSVVSAKKHTKGKPFQVAIKGDNNVVIVNTEGSEMKIEPKALEILQGKMIDVDLNKIVEPLRVKSIEEVQLKTDLEQGATITAQERNYFETEPASITSQDVEI